MDSDVLDVVDLVDAVLRSQDLKVRRARVGKFGECRVPTGSCRSCRFECLLEVVGLSRAQGTDTLSAGNV